MVDRHLQLVVLIDLLAGVNRGAADFHPTFEQDQLRIIRHDRLADLITHHAVDRVVGSGREGQRWQQ